MRPEVQKQQPHHFIRRWPKARRDKRGPDEYMELVEVECPQQESREKFIRVASALLVQKTAQRCKPGWVFTREGSWETIQRGYGEPALVRILIRFTRNKT